MSRIVRLGGRTRPIIHERFVYNPKMFFFRVISGERTEERRRGSGRHEGKERSGRTREENDRKRTEEERSVVRGAAATLLRAHPQVHVTGAELDGLADDDVLRDAVEVVDLAVDGRVEQVVDRHLERGAGEH